MRSMFIALLLSLANLSFGHEAFACSSPELSKTLIESIERITQVKTPWNKFEYESLRFVFSSQNSSVVYGYNFTQNELNNFSGLSTQCDSKYWHALTIDSLPTPANGIYEPQNPYEQGTTLQKLAFAHKAPVMFMLAEPNIGTSLTDEFIARIGVHELFHFQFQFAGNFKIGKGYPRDYLDKCARNEKWRAHLDEEFTAWSSLLKNWDSYSQAFLLEKVKAIISKRYSYNTEEEKFCWDATRFWERLEGTAYYVETESAIKAGFSTQENIRAEALKYLDSKSSTVSTGAPETHQIKVNPSFFYATGALFMNVTRHLSDKDDLERLIEAGLSPEEALAQIIENTFNH